MTNDDPKFPNTRVATRLAVILKTGFSVGSMDTGQIEVGPMRSGISNCRCLFNRCVIDYNELISYRIATRVIQGRRRMQSG